VSEFAVTAVGRDRPGIVAAISEVLFELGGNVEDSRMSILRGHFAVMLIVELGDEAARDRLESELGRVRDQLGLEAISVSEVETLSGVPDSGPGHVLTVYGSDRPGIVHRITSLLAERDVNVTDLSTLLAGGDEPIYVMMIEIAIGDVAEEELRAALEAAAAELEVDVSLRPLEGEAL
jgi:glycine cleavage system transcriptional repressor